MINIQNPVIFLFRMSMAIAMVLALSYGAYSQTSGTTPASTTPASTTPASTTPASEAKDMLESVGELPTSEIPFYADWAASPHADYNAKPFNHWNSTGSIPVTCARCHSAPGFEDYLGADGTADGVVNNPAPVGTVITCKTCHNAKTLNLSTVTFPSGVELSNLGGEAICMTCHQGRKSTDSVNKQLSGLDDDKVLDKLSLIETHHAQAAETLEGSIVRGGYQYSDKTYAGPRQHPQPYTNCIACHNMHTTQVKVDDCKACHQEVSDIASLSLIRIGSNTTDYDGDGNITEGVAQEIDGLSEHLLTAIMKYAKNISGKPIVNAPDSYPFFFIDTNDNGIADKDETIFPNKYNAWTPRLLRAAYNYQFVQSDSGAYAHNGSYVLQLLYDSINDLANKTGTSMNSMNR